ncbi:histidine phosphatase family protein [Nocardioides marmoriginsengisoli]|uniref:Histidine phosphatase family protein n=1 Tax=Nocardioides marmoriginsengisoli TaxID=661483 RepID=A0A3N0CJZ3_9ACTN|nr:histidine phosphatase family protein [Nocardioides marmoriginsengisoli]RNL63770.1 histidine phosphatase family protein [Nocardioides marmoriginsengisoli]
MTRLVLVRHGRTGWNLEGRAQGHTDVGLDEVGRAQAEAVAPCLAEMGPTALWSSDLARARQTAARIAAATGLEVAYDARLREFDVGERAGLTVPEFAEKYPESYAAWKAGHITGDVPGAETITQVVDRMVPALREIWSATPAEETSVVVSHGACLKISLVAFLGWPDEVANTLRGLDNCGWVVLEDDPSGRGVRLASYNETVHPAIHGPDFASEAPVG